jgi:4-hydroxy-tetrahydrodipicolinate reductase
MKEPRVRVLLVGSAGRMGKTIADVAREHPDIEIVAFCDLGDPLEPAISRANVVIDFSHASAIGEICRVALQYKQPIVIGTTGHSPEQLRQIEKCAESLPVVLASNFSIGVNALFWLTRKAAEMLGPDFDIEIVEMHHRMKKDAPSGTAKTLAQILKETRKSASRTDSSIGEIGTVRHGREGNVGERTQDEIGVHSIRGGDVVGDHTVIFAGAGERLELTHRASRRETFAHGALRAAQWVVGKPPGLYTMGDVLGL